MIDEDKVSVVGSSRASGADGVSELAPSAPYFTECGNQVLFYDYAEDGVAFGEDVQPTVLPIPGTDSDSFIAWGADNRQPYHMMRLIGQDEVMSGNKLFNVLTCYGAGLRYERCDGGPSDAGSAACVFFRRNALGKFFLEQVTDMKYFYFAVCVVYLNMDGTQIVRLRHREAAYCRFAKADSRGHIPYVYFGDFDRGGVTGSTVERVRLLDEVDPLGDLMVLLGRERGSDGRLRVRTRERKFAVVCKFPTVGNRYYPQPYYTSLFRGNWYEIKRLIGLGKRVKLRNHCGLRYLVEINDEYWKRLYQSERLTDDVSKARRQIAAKEEITRFLSGIENSGKALYSGFYKNPAGEEVSMIRITNVDTHSEGGDWASDLEEASNVLCFVDNVHPNLVGASPGKGGQNNSGSDKRELFTLKQSLETAFKDVLRTPHDLVLGFNGWDDYEVVAPLITLTTLDQHKDAQLNVLSDGAS